MSSKREFVKRAFDANAFITSDADAARVNPTIWEQRLREHEERLLVITPLAEFIDFTGAGNDLYISIATEPSAAAEVAETDAISISALGTRRVTFTPTERGVAYQLSKKEAVRPYFNVVETMTSQLGYGLARRKDQLAYNTLTTSTDTNGVIVNGVAAQSSIASTDTLDYDAILDAMKENEDDLFTEHAYLIVSPQGKQQLLNLGTINKANEFGSRSAIERGVIGSLFGADVIVSHSVTTQTDTATFQEAVLLSRGPTGQSPFAYAQKRLPEVEREYHALERRWDIVAHEEYDFQLLYPEAVCTISHYAA